MPNNKPKDENEREKVIKTLLSSSFRDTEHKDAICRAIQERVLLYSKRIRNASLGMNCIIKFLFDGEPDVRDVQIPERLFDLSYVCQLMLGMERARRRNYYVELLHEAHPELLLDPTARNLSDSNIYTFGAIQYLTNVKNHLRMNLWRFMLRVCHAHPTWTKFEAIAVARRICGYPCHSLPQTEEARQYIREHRRVLGLSPDGTDAVTEAWYDKKKNLFTILRYFVYLGRVLEHFIAHSPPGQTAEETEKLRAQRIGKRFDLLPICKAKPHFITIDSRVLHGILKEMGLVQCNVHQFEGLAMDHWTSIFKIKPPSTQNEKYNFTGTIQSDGISVCIHFRKFSDPEAPAPEVRYNPGDWVVAVDPGANTIIHACVTLPNHPEVKPRQVKLTRCQYYVESGIKKANSRSNTWNSQIQVALNDLSHVSTRGVSIHTFDEYLEIWSHYAETIWNEYTKKRWALQRMHLYSNKKRVYSRFFNRMESVVKEEQTKRQSAPSPFKVAYGGGRFNPAGPGSVAAPTSSAYKECAKRFPTALVDENRTSWIHHKHRCELTRVEIIKGQERRVLRGLLWCDSTRITVGKHFVNRDFNAAMNIMRCFVSPIRPPELGWNNSPLERRIGIQLHEQ